jgi:hypothetical protein
LKRKLSKCSDTETQERILKNKKSDVHETEKADTEDLHNEHETARASCMGDHSAKQKNFQEEKTEDETDKVRIFQILHLLLKCELLIHGMPNFSLGLERFR